MGEVQDIKSKDDWTNLQAQSKSESKTVVVDFSAKWCGPCRMISPYFEELSKQFEGVLFAKVDVDEVEAVAAECNISAMPTFQVWKGGDKVEELVGASKDRLKALIEKHA